MNAATLARFWSKVRKSDGCWEWTASKRFKGYGAFVWPSESGDIVQGRAHRFSWLVHRGEIPPGMCCLHKCDNPACVNPDHLWLGTKAENNRDMIAKGRRVVGGTWCGFGKYHRGVSHHNAKMTPDTVRALRADRIAMKWGWIRLGRKYGISHRAARDIATRKTWRQVE
jgi:hypothetical protein